MNSIAYCKIIPFSYSDSLATFEYNTGSTRSVRSVDAVRPNIIESASGVQVGFESDSGTIPRIVQTDVSKTGSRRVRPASTIA